MGNASSTRGPGLEQTTPVALVPGWHPIEIVLNKQGTSRTVQLVWVQPDGTQLPVQSQDLFPLKDFSGWVQTRTVGLPGGLNQETTERSGLRPALRLGSDDRSARATRRRRAAAERGALARRLAGRASG